MRLKVLLPFKILVDEQVKIVVAEGEDGSFGMLPRHVDYVTTLAPGILSFVGTDDREMFLAVNGGTLVKVGDEVLVSVQNAVLSHDLGTLEQLYKEQFEKISASERKARGAASHLEAGLYKRLAELGNYGQK